MDIPPSWTASLRKISSRPGGKIFVIGETDRGKSTYCRFLARELNRAGFDVALIDGDIGQKDLGPPACLTLGFDGKSGMEIAELYFVGDVTPAGHFLPMIVGNRRLLDSASRADFTIINTTGFVTGPGAILKQYLIEALVPDWIVAIERERELHPILSACAPKRVLRLHPSPQARAKSPDERAANREREFRNYFRAARLRRLKTTRLIFQRGAPIGTAIRPAFQKGRLCGLADRNGRCLGLGLLSHVSPATASVLTPVAAREIRVIQLGDLLVLADGRHERLPK